MPLLAFMNCHERIHWANMHRVALTEAWNDFLEADPYGTGLRIDDDGTGSITVGSDYEVMPNQFAQHLGEMLYQLRAALDGSVYAAVVQQSGEDPPPNEHRIEFPICDSERNFEDAAWKIEPLTDERRAIIESVQPFAASPLAPELVVFNFNRALAILNDWARKDRHRKLHFVGSWAANAKPKLRLPPGVRLVHMEVAAPGTLLERERHVTMFRLDGYKPGMKVEANPDLTIELAVNEPPPAVAGNDTLANRVVAMIEAVGFVVGSLERSFPGGGSLADRR